MVACNIEDFINHHICSDNVDLISYSNCFEITQTIGYGINMFPVTPFSGPCHYFSLVAQSGYTTVLKESVNWSTAGGTKVGS